MHNYLLDIARTGLNGKKRSSIYLLLACFFSVAFAVINVSVTGSLNKTREELRYAMYGEWTAAVYSQDPFTEELQDKNIRAYGTAQIYGNLLDGGETTLTGIGTLDENLRSIGHLEAESGTFPAKDNEIALEAAVLSDLGYDYELGQTLTLRIRNKEDEIIVKEYILCGILREYTRLWNTGTEKAALAGACVTENGAKELGAPCSYQYFLSTEKEESRRLCQQLKKDCANTVENSSAYGPLAKEDYHYFSLALILLTTIAAVVVIYSIQLNQQIRSIQLFRTIGATKKQLSAVIFYETLLILLPAAAGGIAAGSLATWILIRLLMARSAGAFYISIPAALIGGILLLWFGAVFAARLLIFRYSLRGRLAASSQRSAGAAQLSRAPVSLRRRLAASSQSSAGAAQKGRNHLGRLLLSSVSILAVIFCYLESLSPIYIDQIWAQSNSYILTPGMPDSLITDEYLESITSLPGIERVTAQCQLSGTLEFPGIEENPFCAQLAQQPWTHEEYGPARENGPDGMLCEVFGITENNWEQFFQYTEETIDREKFKNGESFLLYLPYNTETGIELDGNLYQDFGVSCGDRITVSTYGKGELDENGTEHIRTKDGETRYQPYGKPEAVSRSSAQVAGIITADLNLDPSISMGNNYYGVIASNAFAKKLTETDRDGVLFYNGSWSNQEYSYTAAHIYTGMDAEFLSTDYLMAKSAAEHYLDLWNRREQNTALRQEALQTLLHIWILGLCIFLILALILWNIEMLRALAQKRSFALLQVIGMSRRQLRLRLAAKSLFVSLISCLLGHAAYLLYFAAKHIQTYRSFQAEFEYAGTFLELLKEQFETSCLQAGWSLPVHLAFCAFAMACIFLLSFCPQNQILKKNIRENLS